MVGDALMNCENVHLNATSTFGSSFRASFAVQSRLMCSNAGMEIAKNQTVAMQAAEIACFWTSIPDRLIT
jgi:hypothetical protein